MRKRLSSVRRIRVMKHRQQLWLPASLVLIVMTSAQCGGSLAPTRAQSQSGPQINTGVAQKPGPALQGKVVGELKPFEPTGKDLKASLFSHPVPEVWLNFPDPAKQGSQQNAASDGNESAIKVKMPPKARKLLISRWKIALAANYNLEIARPPGVNRDGSQLTALINSYLNVSSELMKIQIDAPDGRRTISQDEAKGLSEFMGASALNLVEQAKKYK
jgi:hypothetical protein